MKTRRYGRLDMASVRPSQTDGHVYYVRLKTPLGLFYKLGFTTLESVADRLAYQAVGDERLIDEVLLFVYLEDGYNVETMLHRHFKARAASTVPRSDPNLPLHRNGQSELYIDDIFGLDPGYDVAQAHATRKAIRDAELARIDDEVQRLGGPKPLDPDVAQIMTAIEGPVTWLFRAYAKFCMLFASESERMRQAAHNGRHYQIKLATSLVIETILAKLLAVRNSDFSSLSKKERTELKRRLMREAGIVELPVAATVIASLRSSEIGTS